MLKKENRLPLKTKLDSKLSISTQYFVLKIAKNESMEKRIAVIIGKAIDKRAVYRNRTRRLIHEAVASVLQEIKPGTDLLFIVKKAILGKSIAEILEETKKALKKENLLK